MSELRDAYSYCHSSKSDIFFNSEPSFLTTLAAKEDLYAFHSRIFGAKATSNLPSSLIVNASEVNKDGVEDEDDLGYYPDGVKRTLTDDQIAMFRCSEIYALLRERQLKREKEKADADGHQSNLVSDSKIFMISIPVTAILHNVMLILIS